MRNSVKYPLPTVILNKIHLLNIYMYCTAPEFLSNEFARRVYYKQNEKRFESGSADQDLHGDFNRLIRV